MSEYENIVDDIINAVKDNLITPDQAVPYARELMNYLVTEISNIYVHEIRPRVKDRTYTIYSLSTIDNKVVIEYYADFYFDQNMIILHYDTYVDDKVVKSRSVSVSEGREALLSFEDELKDEVDYILTLDEMESSSELESDFLTLNNYLPANLRTDDPYKLVGVIKVLLEASLRIRKLSEK